MTGMRDGVGERQRRLDVEALEHAVAGDVGVDDRGDAGVLEPAAKLVGRHARRLRPALDGDTPVAGVDADRDPSGIEPGGLAHEVRIAHRRGADDDAAHAACRASPRRSSCRGCRRRAAPAP